jgi:hypothetical protein
MLPLPLPPKKQLPEQPEDKRQRRGNETTSKHSQPPLAHQKPRKRKDGTSKKKRSIIKLLTEYVPQDPAAAGCC